MSALGRSTTRFSCLVALTTMATLGTSSCLELREDAGTAPRKECTTCHGGTLEAPFEAAPPYNLSGDLEKDARGNGAHEAHLLGSGRARVVPCADCHLVPDDEDAAGHMDSEYPAEVELLGVARAFGAQPEFVSAESTCRNTFCHGGSFVGGRPSGGTHTEPLWTSTDPDTASCTGCHGAPPPAPHPATEECSECHQNIGADGSFSRPDLHVDGTVTFYLPSDP